MWRSVITIGQRFLQEYFGSLAISRLRQVEIHSLAMGVHSAEQVHPLAGDPDEGFVHVPGRGFPLYLALQASVQFRAVRLSPAPNGGMVDSHAPLRHQLFHVTQTQAEPQIPSDASHDDVRLELAFP